MCLEDSKKTVKIYFDSAIRDEGTLSDFTIFMPNEIQGISILKPCRVWVESSSILAKDNADDLGSDYVFLCSNINQYQSLNTTTTYTDDDGETRKNDNYSNSQILFQYPIQLNQGRTATDLYYNYQNNSGDTAIYCPAGLPSQLRFYLCDKTNDKLTFPAGMGGERGISLLLCVQFY